MRHLLATTLLLATFAAHAQVVIEPTDDGQFDLVWELPHDDLTAVRIYYSQDAVEWLHFDVGGDVVRIGLSRVPAGVWHFEAASLRGGVASARSNRATADVPLPPTGFRLGVLISHTIIDPNWQEVGAIYVKIKTRGEE